MYRINWLNLYTLVSCCCFGADHTKRSSRDAADTISTGSLFQSRTVLGKKELEYVPYEILSWKNLVGPLVWLSLTCKYLSMCMSTRLCCILYSIKSRSFLRLTSRGSRFRSSSSWWHILEFWNGSHYRHSVPLVSAFVPMLWCEFVGLGPR